MTTEPTTPRDSVARLIERLRASAATGAPPHDPNAVYRTRPVTLFEEAADCTETLLTPDSTALTALKLAAVEYDGYEGTNSLSDSTLKYNLFVAAKSFAKEQREGAA